MILPITYSIAVPIMPKTRYSWKRNEREHAAERRAMADAVRSGEKTPWQIQEENSIFPLNSTVEIDFADLNKRYKRTHA